MESGIGAAVLCVDAEFICYGDPNRKVGGRMKAVQETTDFENTVDSWVSTRFAAGPMTWNELVNSLPSVYPEIILNSAKRLDLIDEISFTSSHSSGSLAPCFALDLWAARKAQTPHTLDSTWWFGDAALGLLLERIGCFTASSDRVLLLGVPTLWHYAKDRSGNRKFLLLDRERSREQSKFTTANLLTDQPSLGKMDLIVVDPPWYPAATRAFVVTALRNARPGSKILLSVPPIGTRPGVEQEWRALLGWAGGLGLHLKCYESGVLPYVSPLFERNALRAAGIASYPEQWRRGDLATFEWDGTSECPVNVVPGPGPEEWSEGDFGGVRFRLRTGRTQDWESPILREIVRGDVLPSVSRRDPRLESVAAWTSGNRVFACEGTYILGIIAQAFAEDRCALTAVASVTGGKLSEKQSAEVERTIAELSELVAIEEKEIEDWGSRQNDGVVKLSSYQR